MRDADRISSGGGLSAATARFVEYRRKNVPFKKIEDLRWVLAFTA